MNVLKPLILLQPMRSPLKWNGTGIVLAWIRDLLRPSGPQFPFGTSSLGHKPAFHLRPPQGLGTYKKFRLISGTLREVANLL
jgi:hypothetical protein